ncbi:MAG: efflux RND transporter periplasmic adaptor subunit [Candidatus Doudnabacteria bacterium]|nr:efflux RND transporter periplasmic adaptor subunit [Candidatus Doudnabacteria bacterium]
MEYLKKIIKNKFAIGGIIIVVLIGGYLIYKKVSGASASVSYVTSPVTKGTLTVSVSSSGQVEASNQLEIKPQTDGTITSVRVKENQQVKAGDVLAIIDQQSAANDVAKAQASLEQAQASYEKLIEGATSNEIETQKLAVKSAQQALDQAKQDYNDTVEEQQQNVDSALNSYLNSGLETTPSDNLSSIPITLSGNYSGTAQGKYTISTFVAGDGTHYQSSGLGTGSGVINRGQKQSLGNGLYITFGTSGTISGSTTWTIDVPNKTADNYSTSLDAYNSAVRNQKQAVQKAQNSIDSAQNSLDKANLQMDNLLAAASNADISSAKAQITSAKAQLENARTAYNKTIIKAPFDGVIASLTVSAGDEANAGTTILTIITKQQVAKVSFNEVDAAKVKVGQKAVLTFSSVPDLTITGVVEDVDNIGTVSQNVVNFSVVILFDTQDARIKPGMSVSASIITDVKQDVLMVPSAAVKTSNGSSYVQVLSNGQPVQKTVTAGSSNDTDTEISGDIAEGDEVVTQTITGTAATKTSGTNLLQSLLGGNRARTTTTGSTSARTTSGSGATVIQGGPPGGF